MAKSLLALIIINMAIVIIGPEGEETNDNGTNGISVPENYDMPENREIPGLEIIEPEKQEEKPILPPGLFPYNIPTPRRINEILGDN